MFDALTEKPPGRPEPPPEAAELDQLREKVESQQEKIEELHHRERLIRRACDLKIQMYRGHAEKKYGH